jgi:hypothetical protein
MSNVTIEKVVVNLPKFREVRGDLTLADFAETIDIKADMYSKIERGKRWTTLQRFAEFCMQTNREPNDFFEIVKKLS